MTDTEPAFGPHLPADDTDEYFEWARRHREIPDPHDDAGDDIEFVPMEEALEAARKLGAEHGHAAGTWAFDGNTPLATYTWALKGIRDGDPAVLDSFPTEPGIDGSNEYTSRQLYAALDLIYELADAEEIQRLSDAYAAEARNAFWAEVERAAIYQVEG